MRLVINFGHVNDAQARNELNLLNLWPLYVSKILTQYAPGKWAFSKGATRRLLDQQDIMFAFEVPEADVAPSVAVTDYDPDAADMSSQLRNSPEDSDLRPNSKDPFIDSEPDQEPIATNATNASWSSACRDFFTRMKNGLRAFAQAVANFFTCCAKNTTQAQPHADDARRATEGMQGQPPAHQKPTPKGLDPEIAATNVQNIAPQLKSRIR